MRNSRQSQLHLQSYQQQNNQNKVKCKNENHKYYNQIVAICLKENLKENTHRLFCQKCLDENKDLSKYCLKVDDIQNIIPQLGVFLESKTGSVGSGKSLVGRWPHHPEIEAIRTFLNEHNDTDEISKITTIFQQMQVKINKEINEQKDHMIAAFLKEKEQRNGIINKIIEKLQDTYSLQPLKEILEQIYQPKKHQFGLEKLEQFCDLPRNKGMQDAMNYFYKNVIDVQDITFNLPNLNIKIEQISSLISSIKNECIPYIPRLQFKISDHNKSHERVDVQGSRINIQGQGMGTIVYSEPFLKTDTVCLVANLSGDILKNCTYLGITSEKDKDKYCFFPTGNQICIHCEKPQCKKKFTLSGETNFYQLLKSENIIKIEVSINVSENIFTIKDYQNRFTIQNAYDFSQDLQYDQLENWRFIFQTMYNLKIEFLSIERNPKVKDIHKKSTQIIINQTRDDIQEAVNQLRLYKETNR